MGASATCRTAFDLHLEVLIKGLTVRGPYFNSLEMATVKVCLLIVSAHENYSLIANSESPLAARIVEMPRKT